MSRTQSHPQGAEPTPTRRPKVRPRPKHLPRGFTTSDPELDLEGSGTLSTSSESSRLAAIDPADALLDQWVPVSKFDKVGHSPGATRSAPTAEIDVDLDADSEPTVDLRMRRSLPSMDARPASREAIEVSDELEPVRDGDGDPQFDDDELPVLDAPDSDEAIPLVTARKVARGEPGSAELPSSFVAALPPSVVPAARAEVVDLSADPDASGVIAPTATPASEPAVAPSRSLASHLASLRSSEETLHTHLAEHELQIEGVVEEMFRAIHMGGRVWVAGEADLHVLAPVIVYKIFGRGGCMLPSGVLPRPSRKLEKNLPSSALPGDLVLAFALDGYASRFSSQLALAKERGLVIAVVRPAGTSPSLRGDHELPLPVKGFSWVMWAALVVGRLLKRLTRDRLAESKLDANPAPVAAPGDDTSFAKAMPDVVGDAADSSPTLSRARDPLRQAPGAKGPVAIRRDLATEMKRFEHPLPVPAGVDAGECSVALALSGPPEGDSCPWPVNRIDANGMQLVISGRNDCFDLLQPGTEVWLRIALPSPHVPLFRRGRVSECFLSLDKKMRIDVRFDDAASS